MFVFVFPRTDRFVPFRSLFVLHDRIRPVGIQNRLEFPNVFTVGFSGAVREGGRSRYHRDLGVLFVRHCSQYISANFVVCKVGNNNLCIYIFRINIFKKQLTFFLSIDIHLYPSIHPYRRVNHDFIP